MTAIRLRLILIAAACAGLWLGIGEARAGGLEVAPIGVDFNAGQMAQIITVTNRADAPATVQLRTFAWSQPGGVERLAPTDAVVASPPIVTIPPGREQVIRVLLRRPASGTVEQAYRLTVDEIPVLVPGRLNVALHLSLPIFVSSGAAVRAQVAWSARPAGGGAIELVARNSGTRHARFDGLSVTTRGGAASAAFGGYVLPGQEKRWRIAARGLDRAGQVALKGAGDQGDVNVTLALDGQP
ncbi:fimbrial chaperone protein [Inquilinus ginsengisoli]|uniref:Fimbrial chaperone protein n=1 Tax=Inquilinus ginsengisoli TaxID=363840 RepID=A0ABU1JU21_9PROT|nr:fimbria/pilus periplasmic chaperone [Inquilinus ginsengisoli]MDR6292115.1 fimbrial chaperone protein [Inquilinus ginsengisoli]